MLTHKPTRTHPYLQMVTGDLTETFSSEEEKGREEKRRDKKRREEKRVKRKEVL